MMNKKRKKTRKTHQHSNWAMRIVMIITTLLAVYGLICLIGNLRGCSKDADTVEEATLKKVYITPKVKFNGRYADTFDDVQEVQIEAAMHNGISPLESDTGFKNLLSSGKIVKVGQGRGYDCQADYPYLVPMAKELLEEVKRRYLAMGDTGRTVRLTGCMRTKESVKGLKRRNVNSVENSCHLYGTTIDISYRWMSQAEKAQMAQVLYELQQAGYCYVKYERKQPCFHITVRRSPDLVETE